MSIASVERTKDGRLTIALFGQGVSVPTILKALGLAALMVAPMVMPGFTHVLTSALIFVVFAVGMDFVWGYGGVLTFGQGVFFGIGAYVAGKAFTEGWIGGPDFLVILLAAAVPTIIGLVLAGALFYQRMDPLNFAVITLVMAALGQQVATSLTGLTGGSNGVVGIPSLTLGIPGVVQFEMNQLQYYYFALVIALLAYAVAYFMLQSRFGTALISIRENTKKARSLGYNIKLYKTLAFGIACAFAGFSGGLYATHVGFISPVILGFAISTQVVIWVLIGGKGSLTGAFVGPVLILLLERVLADALLFSWRLALGLALVTMILVLPGGITSLYDRIGMWMRSREEIPFVSA